jgi:hypothetical protein
MSTPWPSLLAGFETHLVLAGRPGVVLHARLLLFGAYLAGCLSLRRRVRSKETHQQAQAKSRISHSIFLS